MSHERDKHPKQPQHAEHSEHSEHSGHKKMHGTSESVRSKDEGVIVTVPILILSPMIQQWFGFTLNIPYREAIIFVLATFIYLYGGKPFLTMTVDEIKSKKPGMMTLISMAISVAYFYSAMTLVMPGGKEFFWELATLIDIMLIGHYIEAKSVLGAADALEELVKMMPKTAMRVKPDGGVEEVSVDELRKEDLILVRHRRSIAHQDNQKRQRELPLPGHRTCQRGSTEPLQNAGSGKPCGGVALLCGCGAKKRNGAYHRLSACTGSCGTAGSRHIDLYGR